MKNILISAVTALVTTLLVMFICHNMCGSCKGDSCHKPKTECVKGKSCCKKGKKECKKDCKKACCKKAESDSTATETEVVEIDSTTVEG